MVRVLIAAPSPLLSDLIETVCSVEADLQIVGSISTGQEAIQFNKEDDVLVASADLPDGGALRLARNRRQIANKPAVVAVGLPDVESVPVRYPEAGAAGCVCTQDSPHELVRVIRTAARRQVALMHDLITRGYGNRAIAKSLTIEVGTRKNHVHNNLDKLRLRNRRDAAVSIFLGFGVTRRGSQ